jgi:hypothetical protein
MKLLQKNKFYSGSRSSYNLNKGLSEVLPVRGIALFLDFPLQG